MMIHRPSSRKKAECRSEAGLDEKQVKREAQQTAKAKRRKVDLARTKRNSTVVSTRNDYSTVVVFCFVFVFVFVLVGWIHSYQLISVTSITGKVEGEVENESQLEGEQQQQDDANDAADTDTDERRG